MWALCSHSSLEAYILSGIWQGLLWRTDTKQRQKYYNEIGLFAQNIDTILGSIVYSVGRAYVILQRKRESALCLFYNFCIFIAILKLWNDNPCDSELLTGCLLMVPSLSMLIGYEVHQSYILCKSWQQHSPIVILLDETARDFLRHGKL